MLSVRCCLHLLILLVEAAFILIFFFLTSYDSSQKDQKTLLEAYQGESSWGCGHSYEGRGQGDLWHTAPFHRIPKERDFSFFPSVQQDPDHSLGSPWREAWAAPLL